MEKYYVNIGNNVRNLRIKKGLTQLELSKLMGFKSRSLVSKAEVGKEKRFGIEHIIKLCEIFQCKISDIVILL